MLESEAAAMRLGRLLDDESTGGSAVEEIIFELVSCVSECSYKNIFGCVENVVLLLLAVVSAVCGVIALRRIMRDRNRTLDLWDKVIVSVALS